MTRAALIAESRRLHAASRKIVFTNGCFDILHSGHVASLMFARRQGDVLVVGLSSDASIKRSKGPGRPVNNERERALLLAALEVVDYVVVYSEDEPAALIEQVRPDVLVKGRDWAHYVSGREAVERRGGRVALAPMLSGKSTTRIIARLRRKGAAGHE